MTTNGDRAGETDLSLTDIQYLKILLKIRTTLKRADFSPKFFDCQETGYKETTSNCGFCNEDFTEPDTALFPDEFPARKSMKYRRSDHRCPFDRLNDPHVFSGYDLGCYYRCILFHYSEERKFTTKDTIAFTETLIGDIATKRGIIIPVEVPLPEMMNSVIPSFVNTFGCITRNIQETERTILDGLLEKYRKITEKKRVKRKCSTLPRFWFVLYSWADISDFHIRQRIGQLWDTISFWEIRFWRFAFRITKPRTGKRIVPRSTLEPVFVSGGKDSLASVLEMPEK